MKFSLKLVIFYVLFLPFFANAEKVNEIQIFGLENISRGTVLNYLPFEKNDEIDNTNAKQAIDNLLGTGFFKKVSLNSTDGKIILNIVENPVISFFELIGNEDNDILTEDVIEKIQQNFNIATGKIFNDNNLNELINNIKLLYKSRGYFDTEINTSNYIDTKNRISITLNISEGSKTRIGSLKISGNKFFSESDLLDLLEIGEPDFFLINYFTEKDIFSYTAYEAGLEAIKSKYLESGFLDVKVLSSKFALNDKEGNLDIEIKVDEGIQYKLNSITFEGATLNFSNSYLRSLFSIEDGEIFERQKIVSGIKKVSSVYENEGYAYASIKSYVKDSENNNLNISISIDTDSMIFIDRIEISGNTTTQDDVIRRELMILENQVYSKDIIDSSIKKIKRLGYFSDVKYRINRKKNTPDRADILIDVIETKTGEISIGLSHSNSTGAAVTAGISQNNILGTGNTLKAAFSNSDAVKETSLYFQDPYFNNLDHKISYGLFSKEVTAENLEASSYVLNNTGASFGYGIPIDEDSEIFSELFLSNIDLSCGSDLKNLYEISDCSKSSSTDSTISLTYKTNSLDDFYFASSGSSNSFKTIISTPLSDTNYFKIETKHKNYIPVFNNKTFKSSSRVNLARGFAGDDLPFYKRYFEGGASSIRGFDFNSLGSKYSNDKPKGGEFSIVSSLALASNLKFAGIDNDNMRLSGFIDAGNISETISKFQVDEIRVSSGFEFTWLTPIGPIGLVLATPLVKKPDDKTQTLSFELGTTF